MNSADAIEAGNAFPTGRPSWRRRHTCVAAIFVWLLAIPIGAGAQGPVHLVKDINTTPDRNIDSDPSGFVTIGDITYFVADDGVNGRQIWRTDGTTIGTWLVRPIAQRLSDPVSLTNVGGTLFFVAANRTYGCGLWRSDGTDMGTLLLKNFSYGDVACSGAFGFLGPVELTDVNGTLFFNADDDEHGRELWKSDGTADGTALVKDIQDGAEGSGPGSLINLNGTLLFVADDGLHGHALWTSDGTAAGTRVLKALSPLPLRPAPLVKIGRDVFFFDNESATGAELWKTDGTGEGTVLVSRVPPSLRGLQPLARERTVVGDTLFFLANRLLESGLWRSDGTADGTLLVRDFPVDRNLSPSHGLTAVDDRLFFSASQAETGPELWVSDGTANGTRLVKDIHPGASGSALSQLTAVNGALFFVADDGTHGCELWLSDGTEAGTSLLRDINPSTDCGGTFEPTGPSALTNADGTLLFSATDGVLGRELYRSDGTAASTVLVKDINEASLRTADAFPPFTTNSPIGAVNGVLLFTADDGSQTRKLWKTDGSAAGTSPIGAIDAQAGVVVNGTLFFGAGGGLWRSDGTMGGSALVKAIPSYFFLPFPGASAVVGNTLFFVAGNSELWRSDGTTLGTTMVKTLSSSGFGIGPVISSLTKVGDTLFFIVAQQTSTELWRSDGSETGTIALRTFTSNLSDLAALNGKLFFSAGDPVTGVKLWTSDGTPNGTAIVDDIDFDGARLSSPLGLIAVNGSLHFVACDAVHGCALWRSDGSTTGTVIVKVVLPDAGQVRYVSGLVTVNDVLVFAICADEGECTLWRSDGTEPGTFPIANAVPRDVVVAGRTLFFTEEVPGTGALLWKSDGTAAGTMRIKVVDSRPPETVEERQLNLTSIGEQIVFTGYDAPTGSEPWMSDGTEAGTKAMRDIAPGAPSSSPSYPFQYTVVGSTVFFAADDGQHGRELWAVSFSPSCVGDCDGSNEVTIDELVTGVAIALGIVPPDACATLDSNHDDEVTVDELVTAINNALNGCR